MNATTKSSMSLRSRRRRTLTTNDSKRRPWATLISDLLMPLLMQLGFIDFCACAGVCKDWRSIAIDYRSTFLQNQQPLAFVKSKYAKKTCFLHNIFDGTRYKTLLPDLTSRWLVGLSCGYLIMLADTRVWLLNPITRHGIHFSMLPLYKSSEIRAIIFYSEEVSENLLLVFNRDLRHIMLSQSSIPEWHRVVPIGSFEKLVDVAYFNGNIHILTSDAKIGTLELEYQTLNFTNCTTLRPQFQSVRFYTVRINIQVSLISPLHLVPSNDELFMVSHVHQGRGKVIMVHKLDERRMEWIQVNDLGEDALFLSEGGTCAVVNPTKWRGRSNCIYYLSNLRNQCRMYALNSCKSFWNGPVIQEKGSFLQPHFWYFPQQVYNKNIVHGKKYG